MKYDTIEQATTAWVQEFNSIPRDVVEKLEKARNYSDFYEITPPSKCDRVCLLEPSQSGERYGEIIDYEEDDDVYVIALDDETEVKLEEGELEVQKDYGLPIWGTMWQFSDSCDNWWLGENLRAMADCGFRIYESEDFEYVFGIDGAGYSFKEAHFIPLYKARGLHWHKEKEAVAEESSEVAESDEQSDYDEAAKNLIIAMFDYARETCMTERDAFFALTEVGIGKEDFEKSGFGEYVQQFYDEQEEEGE